MPYQTYLPYDGKPRDYCSVVCRPKDNLCTGCQNTNKPRICFNSSHNQNPMDKSCRLCMVYNNNAQLESLINQIHNTEIRRGLIRYFYKIKHIIILDRVQNGPDVILELPDGKTVEVSVVAQLSQVRKNVMEIISNEKNRLEITNPEKFNLVNDAPLKVRFSYEAEIDNAPDKIYISFKHPFCQNQCIPDNKQNVKCLYCPIPEVPILAYAVKTLRARLYSDSLENIPNLPDTLQDLRTKLYSEKKQR